MYSCLAETDLFLLLRAEYKKSAAHFLVFESKVSELLKTDAKETEGDEGLSIISFFLVAADLLIFLAALQGNL